MKVIFLHKFVFFENKNYRKKNIFTNNINTTKVLQHKEILVKGNIISLYGTT
jgi:hypothetical protein